MLNDQIEKDVRDDRRGHAKDPSNLAASASRSAIFTPAGWIEAGDRAARHRRRSSPISPRSTPSKTAASSSTCSSSPASHSPVGIDDFRRPEGPDALLGLRRPGAASAFPTATIICSRAPSTTPIRNAYRDYIADLSELAGIPDRGSARRPHHRARDRDREGPLDARAEPRRRSATYNPMTRAQLQDVRAAVRMGPRARQARARRGRQASSSPRRPRSAAEASCSPHVPLQTWKEYLDLPLHQRPRAIPAQGVRRRALRLLRQDAAATFPSSAHRWKRGVDLRQRQPRRGASGSSTSQRHYPPESDAADAASSSTTSAPRYKDKIDNATLDGRADAQGARWRSSRPSTRASATRSNISIIRRSRSKRGRPASATPCAPRQVRLGSAACALPKAGRPHACGT